MWVLAFQAFDHLGQLWWNDTRLPAIASLFRSQGRKATAAIAQNPIEQGVNRNRSALGVGDLILARGDLLRPSREFTVGQNLQKQRSDKRMAEQGDLFGPRIHGDQLSTSATIAGSHFAAKTSVVSLPQELDKIGNSSKRQPCGTRKRGQPSKWARSSAKRKRCAGIQSIASIICNARVRKSLAGTTVAELAKVAHKAGAC